MIAEYQRANPNIKLAGQPGEFWSYWTSWPPRQPAAKHPRHHSDGYGPYSRVRHSRRSSDLEKSGVDMSGFTEGTVDSGRINGVLVGVNAGINTPAILANPKIFEKAKMDLPDHYHLDLGPGVGGGSRDRLKSRCAVRSGSLSGRLMFGAYLRQNGKELFTRKGCGFEATRCPSLVRPHDQVPKGGRHWDAATGSAKKEAPAVASR